MIDIAIAQLLTQAARLPAAKVTPSTEVRPLADALPRLVYTLIDDPARYTDDGRIGQRRATYQIDIFGQRSTEARSVELSVTARADETDPAKRGLDGYAGTVDQTAIGRIYFGSGHDGVGVNVPGQNQTVARRVVEMTVVYRELLVQPNFTL